MTFLTIVQPFMICDYRIKASFHDTGGVSYICVASNISCVVFHIREPQETDGPLKLGNPIASERKLHH